MKFPITTESKYGEYPHDESCLICGAAIDIENRGSLCLDIAVIVDDEKTEISDVTNSLCINWYSEYGLSYENDHDVLFFDIIKDIPNGQGRVHFCTTPCLRSFFNRVVDHIENETSKYRIKINDAK
jgi:hypothetical protein